MKLYYLLIATALLMSFATGYYSLSLKGAHETTQEDVLALSDLKAEFQKQTPPLATIDLGNFYFSDEHIELIDPLFLRPRTLAYAKKKDIFSSKQECFQKGPQLLGFLDFRKFSLWEEFRCGLRQVLPRDFFYIPPYIHPSGRSYAFLAFLLKKGPYSGPQWTKNHLPFFHITELTELKESIGKLGPPFDTLEKFDFETLKNLAEGQEIIITPLFFLFKTRTFYPLSQWVYHVYHRHDFEKFLRPSAYGFSLFRNGDQCLFHEGNVCWNFNLTHMFRIINTSTLLFFGGSVFLIFLVVGLLISKIKSANREDEKKKLALQVLTHEIRTPISSLLLQVERISKDFDSFHEGLQESFLRLTDDVYRLQRLAERSRDYLRVHSSHKKEKTLALNYIEIPSLNSYLTNFLDPYGEQYPDQIHFHPLEVDQSFILEAYWPLICLKNLLENALAHGSPPVDIFLKIQNQHLFVTVQDAGNCPFTHLQDMCSPFVKGPQSQGSGLGLNIVKKLMEELEGKIDFHPTPTRFILVFKPPLTKAREQSA